jgi:hypothetical protein
LNSYIHDIKQELRAYKKKFYTNNLLKGVIFFFAVLVSAFLVGNLIEFVGNLPTIGRGFIFFSFIGVSLYSLTFWVLYPALQLIRLDNYLSDKEAAIQIGEFFPEVKDKLLNTLELSQLDALDNSLIGESIKQRTKELKKTDFTTAIKFNENKKHFTNYLIAPILILLFILILKPKVFTASSERLINYTEAIVEKAPFTFEWTNKQLNGFKNESLTINLSLTSTEAIPQQCFILIDGKRTLMTKDDLSSYSFTVNRLFKGFKIEFEAAGFQSQSYQVNVYERPDLGNLNVKLHFPSYLHKKDKQLNNTGALKIPEGTKIEWTVKTSQTEKVEFKFDSEETLNTTKNDANYYLTKTIKASSVYEIILTNEHSKNTAPIKYQIDVIKDHHPNIQFKQFSDTLLYKYVLIGGNVSDDYGLTRFAIYYRNADKEKSFKRKNIRLIKGQATQEFFHEIKLDSLAIEEGQKLEYYLAVWDNDGVNGAKMYKTNKQSYILPNKEAIEKQLDEQSEKTSSDMSKSSDKSDDMAMKMKKLQDDLKGKKQLDWQDKKEIEKLLEEHKEFNKQIEELNEQMQKEQMQNERFNKQDEELQKKIDHLNRLMEELLDDDTKKLMEELENLLEKNEDINQIQKKLDEMKTNDEELQKELDRTIELYKKLKFDQQLEKNINELDKLAKEQEELAKKTEDKNNSKEELRKEQDKLNKEFEQLEKKMKELDKMNKELKSQNDMEEFQKEQQDIKKEQQQSSEELKDGSRKKAGKSQKGAADKMKQMAGEMKKMQQSMEMEQMEEDLDNLRQILHNLLYLSFTQEELINSFKKIKQSDPQFVNLSQKQVNLNQSSKVVEDSLYALASRVYQIEPYITKELGDMLKYMKESNESIKARRKNYAVAKQQYAMTSMNNLALLLDDVLKQMQEQMANKKPGQQMCNKPGSGSKPNLGKMQKELNGMIKDLKSGQKEGRKLSQKVAKAAAQQQQIKQGLKQLQKEGGNSKELQKQIRELERLMEQTERDLINKNITDQLIKRQQEINTKLLEAEKAAKKQDFDNKRESHTATTKERNYPPAFDEYIKAKEKQIEMINTIPPNLNPYYKEQVNKYFKRLGT